MQEYKVVAKFGLGQQVFVEKLAKMGDLRMGFVAAILPVLRKDVLQENKAEVFYVLDVDFGNSNPTELLNRAYSESQLLTLEEAKKAAADYFFRMAEQIKKEEKFGVFAEKYYIFKA